MRLCTPPALAAALILAAPAIAAADLFTSIAATGYNVDAVVERNATRGTNPNAYTAVAQALDTANFALFETGLQALDFSGLPQSRQIVTTAGADTLRFLLEPYGNNAGLVNNALRLNAAAPAASLTLGASGSFARLALLGFTTDSTSSAAGDVRLTFGDGSTSTYASAFVAPDWFASAPNSAFSPSGRVSVTLGAPDSLGTGNPKLFFSTFTLTAADQLKSVASIQINRASGGTSYVMGLSGVVAVPEPAGAVLLGLGTLAVAVVTIRRRDR